MITTLAEIIARTQKRSERNEAFITALSSIASFTSDAGGQVTGFSLTIGDTSLSFDGAGWRIDSPEGSINSQEWAEVRSLIAALQASTPLPPSWKGGD